MSTDAASVNKWQILLDSFGLYTIDLIKTKTLNVIILLATVDDDEY